MLKKTALIFVAALIGALWISTPFAHACSCRFPSGGFISPKIGRLPANAAGVVWYTRYKLGNKPIEFLKSHSTVEIWENREFRPLPVKVIPVEDFRDTYVIAPEGAMIKPGATYRITVDRKSNYMDGYKQVFVTIDHENLSPNTKLALDVGPVTTKPIRVAASVSCIGSLKVSQARIKSKLPEDARRWREQLLYRTIVDGNIRWNAQDSNCSPFVPGRSWEAVGHDRVFAPCGIVPSLYNIPHIRDSARHTILIQAFLPGTGVVLETPVKSVSLRCE